MSAKIIFSYVSSNPHSLSIIREAHREFLTGYLNVTTELASHNNFMRRMLGIVPKINKIANDKNYLFMFKAMTDLHHKPILTCDEIKPVLITLLDQYIKNNWFINSDRKMMVEALKFAINNALTLDEIIAIMNEGQAVTLEKDIYANKNSFWRRIKTA